MSADPPGGEAAAAAAAAAPSEVLDLNADATAADSQELGRATVGDETKPATAEALIEPSMGSQEPAVEEGLDGQGKGLPEDGEKEIVAAAGDADADAPARPAADVATGGSEAFEGRVDTGGAVEGPDRRSDRSVEADARRSTGAEILEEKTEATVDHVDGTEDAEELSLRAENRTTEGSPETDGDKSSMEVIQEASRVNLDFPVGSEIGVDVGMVHVNSQPTNEEDNRGDAVAPDLNSAVDVVQSVEPENVFEPVVEKLRGQNDVVAGTNLVIGTATEETHGQDSHMAVTGDSAPTAKIIPSPTSQTSEDQSCDCPTQGGVFTDHRDGRGQEIGEKCEDNSENPPSGGISSPLDAKLADKLPPTVQNGQPEVTSINGNCGTSQVITSDDFLPNKDEKVKAHPVGNSVAYDNSKDTEGAIMSGSGLVGEGCLSESSQLGQNLPSVLKKDPSQVDISDHQFNGGNLSTEVHDSQPSLVAGQDASLPASAVWETEHESIKTDVIPSEEMHGQEENSNDKEDNGVTLSTDIIKNKVAGADTDGDHRELNLAEQLEKEDRFENCSIINPDAAGTENKQHISYHLPLEDNTAFSISDLVWGKVKSHPWWPGQIFDPSNASDLALKHQKRDNFLVAYFGDKTFAWCDESKLKPFQACFSQLENQSVSDAFVNAVNSALAEVSRRLELGMACMCVPKRVIGNLKHQKIENAGIREGSSCSIVDKSFGVATFEPNYLLDYIKALALYPCGGMDRLELVIAKDQLMAFNCLKYHTELPTSINRDGLSENDAITSSPKWKRSRKASGEHRSPTSNDEMVGSDLSLEKRKKKSQSSALHRQRHIPEHGRKEKSLSELMDDKNHSDLVNGDGTATEIKASGKSFTHSSGKKRKKEDTASPYSGKSKRKRLDALGDLEKKTPTSDRSFKVGECISRVASKLTGSPSIIKCNGESLKKDSAGKADQGTPKVFDVSLHTSEDTRRARRGALKNHSSPEEMLSQLCLAAKDPMKGYSFVSAIISFFTEVRELRDSGSMLNKRFEKIKKKRGRKRKSESTDHSKNKLSGADTPSSPVVDEKPPVKIGRKRGRKKKSEFKDDSKTDATEASTPDYMTDSYWTDRIVCSTPEEKSLSSRRKRKGELLIQSSTKKTKAQESLPLSKMLEAAHHLRISAVSPTANRDSTVEKQPTFFGDKCLEESTPTALILSFNEPDALPSETNLIRTFSRYGPLKEAETEVLSETNCAKVVFKRRADAEVAFSSAGKYFIFGPALVSYRLRNLPSTPMASPEVRSDGRKETKTSDDVRLETPAQEEVNELVQKEVGGLTQEEKKESAQDRAEEFTREEAKELTRYQVIDLAEDKAKEVCQEEAKAFTPKEVKELTQAEAKEFNQEVVKELVQDEVKDVAQDEMKELCQEESKELDQEGVKELPQEGVKELPQEEVKEIAQAETKE